MDCKLLWNANRDVSGLDSDCVSGFVSGSNSVEPAINDSRAPCLFLFLKYLGNFKETLNINYQSLISDIESICVLLWTIHNYNSIYIVKFVNQSITFTHINLDRFILPSLTSNTYQGRTTGRILHSRTQTAAVPSRTWSFVYPGRNSSLLPPQQTLFLRDFGLLQLPLQNHDLLF